MLRAPTTPHLPAGFGGVSAAITAFYYRGQC
jgi:hypothetical protein